MTNDEIRKKTATAWNSKDEILRSDRGRDVKHQLQDTGRPLQPPTQFPPGCERMHKQTKELPVYPSFVEISRSQVRTRKSRAWWVEMKSEFFAAGCLRMGQQQEVNKVTGKTASQLRIESSEPKICKNRERFMSRVCSQEWGQGVWAGGKLNYHF